MIRCIIIVAAIGQATALYAGDVNVAPQERSDKVLRPVDLEVFQQSAGGMAASGTNWMEPGAIVRASTVVAADGDPEHVAIAGDGLELFENGVDQPQSDPGSGETPPEDAGTGETPRPPDQVFNSNTAAAQDFHRVYGCSGGIPYLGPPRFRETGVGTTNTWLANPCEGAHGNYYQSGDGSWLGNDKICDASGAFNDPYSTAFRFGWWGVARTGSPAKIGMYQNLASSPFWDIDAVRSNGRQTLDFWMSGLGQDTYASQVNFYAGPGLIVKLRLQDYIHNLGHEPLYGKSITDPPLLPADNVITQDLNVGQDYAIRVQQLDTRFQGRINQNLKWRVNVWLQRKFGDRQANATAHCFDVNAPASPPANNVCHVLSQRQSIDWQTFQIQPTIEANLGLLNVEVSHMLRAFGANDQVVDRQYTRFAPFAGPGNTLGPPWMYAFVPDNVTNIERAKLSMNWDAANQMYGNFYYGYSEDQFRETTRQYSGLDVRYTNRSFDRLTTTTYVNVNADNNSNAPFLIAGETSLANLKHPVDHTWTKAGIKWNWQPIEELKDRLSIASGYEYFQTDRNYARYNTTLGPFSQPDTSSNMIEFSPQMRWTRALYTFLRYKGYFVNDPLVGVREANGRFNTNLPTQEHRVEIGGQWNPSANFMTTAQIGIVDRWNNSSYADFSETSYPFSWTLWYALTDKLSLSGGYGYYSNWIAQDITLGYRFNAFPDQTETTRWNYGGNNHVANVNLAYAVSPTVRYVAGYEFNSGNAAFNVPASPAGANWSQLPSFSDVSVQQHRVTAGGDWQPYENTTLYVRYIYFNFDDLASGVQTGTAHMALAGGGLVY
ncbi:MAG: hypothetical protein U0992_21850 [Planctomycetaceae bacterium]